MGELREVPQSMCNQHNDSWLERSPQSPSADILTLLRDPTTIYCILLLMLASLRSQTEIYRCTCPAPRWPLSLVGSQTQPSTQLTEVTPSPCVHMDQQRRVYLVRLPRSLTYYAHLVHLPRTLSSFTYLVRLPRTLTSFTYLVRLPRSLTSFAYLVHLPTTLTSHMYTLSYRVYTDLIFTLTSYELR